MQKCAELVERDFFKEQFTETEIRELTVGRSVAEIFSWKSPSFKALGLNQADLTEDDLIRLMMGEPRLIRRPLVRIGEYLLVGGILKDLEQLLSAT